MVQGELVVKGEWTAQVDVVYVPDIGSDVQDAVEVVAVYVYGTDVWPTMQQNADDRAAIEDRCREDLWERRYDEAAAHVEGDR